MYPMVAFLLWLGVHSSNYVLCASIFRRRPVSPIMVIALLWQTPRFFVSSTPHTTVLQGSVQKATGASISKLYKTSNLRSGTFYVHLWNGVAFISLCEFHIYLNLHIFDVSRDLKVSVLRAFGKGALAHISITNDDFSSKHVFLCKDDDYIGSQFPHMPG